MKIAILFFFFFPFFLSQMLAVGGKEQKTSILNVTGVEFYSGSSAQNTLGRGGEKPQKNVT